MRQAAINRRSVHRKMITFDIANSRSTGAAASDSLTVVLAENVQRGDVLAVISVSGSLVAYKAKPVADHYFATIGLASSQGVAGDSIGVQTGGSFNSSRYALVIGSPVYVARSMPYGFDHVVDDSECIYEIGLVVNSTTILVRGGLRVVRG